MFSLTPIYDRLVTERGDIPTQTRAEAERIQRDLARVMQAPPLSGLPPRGPRPGGDALPSL
ncbi:MULTISPECIES: hypothetical protein [unclassified Streptomyces]|uniref:hypothetical protein n=1 Tax=unclassified Streptomyces TaxID=2593676 RepID=UPI003D75AD2F